jgi:hypothetical protein
MNTSELRIGNTVQHKTNKEVVNVIHVLENHIGYHNKLLSMKCIDALASNFEPIHLTEEYILRFGFEWKNNGLRNKNICIRQFGGAYCLFLSNESLSFEKRLEFVHQLQNLYFAVVGEELVLQD